MLANTYTSEVQCRRVNQILEDSAVNINNSEVCVKKSESEDDLFDQVT